MDPDDKLAKLIEKSGLFDENAISSDEEWTPETSEFRDVDKKLLQSGASHFTSDIYNDPTPSCSYLGSCSGASLCESALEVHNNYVDSNFKKKLNFETGSFKSDSEDSFQNVEIHSLDDSNVAINNNKKLNCETGIFESDSEKSDDTILNNNESDSRKTDKTTKNKKKKLNFQTGYFETDSEISEEEEINAQKGKKRVSRPELWKKNIEPKKRVADHTLREINHCRCNCKNKLTTTQIEEIHKKFINLENHTQQNIYLQGCLEEKIPERFRPRSKKKIEARNRRVFKYFVTYKGKKTELCQQAFLAVHGIKKDRLKCKVQHPEKDITDGRGRHQKKIVYSEDITKKIHSFIQKIPARASHYCRTSSKHRVYVDSHLSIACLHREFLKQNADLDITVTYEKFRDVFNTDFNISFAVPRKDICSTCTKFQVDIKSADMHNEKKKVSDLKTAHELHLRKAEVFLKKYSTIEKGDKLNHTLSICFDFQKNLPLPVTNVTDEYYLRQLWLHNFGIHNLNDNTASMYMFTENCAHKGPNEVITSLDDFLIRHKSEQHTHLQIFCDNCFSQNKNKYIFTYLDQLCAKGIFQTIDINYPIPGHSMMPIDRDFALVERQKLKHEKIYEPESYVNFVVNSRNTKKFEVVFLEKSLRRTEGDERVLKVKNYKQHYTENIKQSIPGISTCRRVMFKRHSKPEFSTSMTGKNFSSFSLYKVGVSRQLRGTPDDCYNRAIKVKPAKMKDIQKLMQYIPENHRQFYEDLIREQNALNESSGDENDSNDDIE